MIQGCGNSGDESHEANESYYNNEGYENEEEIIPSLDDIIDEISQIAEDEELEVGEEAISVISNLYDEGNYDVDNIFEYLYSNDLFMAQSVDITAGPILIQGDFKNGFTAAQMDLSTGELTTVFSFSNDSNHYTFAFDTTGLNYLDCFFTQELFDKNLTKLAISWIDSKDSSHHVGWIDAEGNLTDITEILHPHSTDFSSAKPNDNYALFSPEGYFVFSDMNSEHYCFVDTNTLEIVDEVDFMIDDTTAYSADFGNIANQIVFMPNGDLKALWHTKDLGYAGSQIIDFGNECWINMPLQSGASNLTSWDCSSNTTILCTGHDDNGQFIAEMGEGIGEQQLVTAGMRDGCYVWGHRITSMDESDHIKITPYTDYYLEKCTYSNEQIAFIGFRGDERFLFIVEDKENSNPTQIAPVDSEWKLLFWK